MKLTNLIFIAGISVVSLLSTDLLARPGMSSYHMLLSDRAVEKLNLTEQQQAQIKSVFEQQKQALTQFKADRQQAHQNLKAIIQAPSFDEVAFRELTTQNQEVKIETSVIKARGKNQIWNLLTEEQQTKLNKMISHRNKKRHNKHTQ